MKQSQNQSQHKVPQVYLKQFGYIYKNQHKVSVMKIGEKLIRQKSIKSFLAEINVFDIKSENTEIERLFEDLNSDIETKYLDIIRDLEQDNFLSEKSYAILLQLIPNFISRSDIWRSNVFSLLKSNVKENFLKIICSHTAKSILDLENKQFYKLMLNNTAENNLNRALLFFMEYLLQRVERYDIVIIKSQKEKPWYTSDTPVIFNNKTANFEFMTKDSEIYFPINPRYVAYLHFKDSNDKVNKLRSYETNKIHIANDEQNWDIQQKILKNANEYVIFNNEFKSESESSEKYD